MIQTKFIIITTLILSIWSLDLKKEETQKGSKDIVGNKNTEGNLSPQVDETKQKPGDNAKSTPTSSLNCSKILPSNSTDSKVGGSSQSADNKNGGKLDKEGVTDPKKAFQENEKRLLNIFNGRTQDQANPPVLKTL